VISEDQLSGGDRHVTFDRKPKAKRFQHGLDGLDLWIAVFGERLLHTFAAKRRCLGKPGHSTVSFCDIS
jgi:hypothetical protein